MKGRLVILHGRSRWIAIGNDLPIRISVPIGINNKEEIPTRLKLIDKLLDGTFYQPDILVDLSLYRSKKRFYEYLLERFTGPIGFLPHYLSFKNDKELLDELERAIDKGISHLTLHFTATLGLFEIAKVLRHTYTTSRGGSIVIKEMLTNKKKVNIFVRNFSEISNILKNTNVVISLGSTFRPSSIQEALDPVHIQETIDQINWALKLNENGIPAMIEGLGHANLSKINEYIELLNKNNNNSPLMTIGPLANDSSLEYDPISAVIGATCLSKYNNFAIVQTITSQEHTGGIPTNESLLKLLEL